MKKNKQGLYPCPLCGNPHVVMNLIATRGAYIACDCGIDFRKYTNHQDVISSWNRRG